MPDSRFELHFWRLVRVLRWQLYVDLIHSSLVARIRLNYHSKSYRPIDESLPVVETVIYEGYLDPTSLRLNNTISTVLWKSWYSFCNLWSYVLFIKLSNQLYFQIYSGRMSLLIFQKCKFLRQTLWLKEETVSHIHYIALLTTLLRLAWSIQPALQQWSPWLAGRYRSSETLRWLTGTMPIHIIVLSLCFLLMSCVVFSHALEHLFQAKQFILNLKLLVPHFLYFPVVMT